MIDNPLSSPVITYYMLEWIVKRYREYPVALTGCRARARDMAYDVCEYNIIVLDEGRDNNLHEYTSEPEKGSSTARRAHDADDGEYIHMDDGRVARIHRLRSDSSMVERVMLLDGMIILNDINSRLSMLESSIADRSMRIKRLRARSLLADALFYSSNAIHARDPLEASFWLKSAACSYIEAYLLEAGRVPMPSHLLAQLRALNDSSISMITECIGLDQANRSSVARATSVIMHLLADRCSRSAAMLIRRKLEYLASMGMYTDAYIYACYTCRELVMARTGIVVDSIVDLPEYDMLCIAMNLSRDSLSTSRLAGELISTCRARLNAY